jgi:hypothetical protein
MAGEIANPAMALQRLGPIAVNGPQHVDAAPIFGMGLPSWTTGILDRASSLGCFDRSIGPLG